MIKFFRKIRFELMEQNKTGRYLKYAIGEVILVVMGILIALWLNNLNTNMQQRIEEISILKELKSDFEADIVDFNINISVYKYVMTSTEVILKSFESNRPYHDSLANDFAGISAWPLSIIHTSAYEVLKSKGFALISNDLLLKKITNLHGQTYAAIKLWENPPTREFYLKDILKRFDKLEPWKMDENGVFSYGIMKPLNYQSLKKDDLYKSIIRSIKNEAQSLLNGNYFTILGEVQEIIKDIEVELQKLD